MMQAYCGRTLVFFGDSLMKEMADAHMCLLQKYDNSPDFVAPTKVKKAASLCAKFLNKADGCEVRVCHVRSPASSKTLFLGKLGVFFKASTLLVMNIGVHVHSPSQYARILEYFSLKWKSRARSKHELPQLVWAESQAQHFPNVGGEYSLRAYRRAQREGCKLFNYVAFNETSIHVINWRNRMANKAMQALGVPILPLWELTVSASPWEHVGMHKHACKDPASVLNPSCFGDCTHHCQPGLPDVSCTLLYQFLRKTPVNS
mmetsp:Transcript_12261/g.25749  ORF Transcript_12261/g.25749 Transcript_12261/m.25749 type:complete len:260 (-) Transcript_12261:389-1168(-)